MYAQFFGLKQAPFSIAPDPRYLFMSERHREALAHLLYGVGGGGGFVLLTGEIGAGKTTVCRCFLEQIPRRCNVAYIFNPKLTVVELLQSICEEFRIPFVHEGPGPATIKDYVDPLNEFLLKTHAVGQNNVLIIDEAQNLSPDVLEQLRLLTNLETSERKLLQIILIGQPELRTMLAQPELEQLAQRVIARFHLEALSEAETAQYIQHRLSIAGLKRGRLFDSQAVKRIHQLTHGVPRRINLLCDRALLGAYVEGKSRVDRHIVDKASAEVFPHAQHKPLPPAGAGFLASWSRWPRWQMATAAGLTAMGLTGLAVSAWVQHRHGDQDASSAQAKAGAAASAASQATSPASTPAVKLASAAQVWDTAYHQESDALRDLAMAWQVTVGNGDPCQPAWKTQLVCFKNSGGLSLIRQLDRPVVLTLHDAKGKTAYALLIKLDAQVAQVQTSEGVHALPLGTLSVLWNGDFTTYWLAPEGYKAKIVTGNSGPVVDWLGDRLARIAGDKPPAAPLKFDAAMQAQVNAFQLAQGLKPDGVVGATTFMLLNRATGIDEPRLQAASPTKR